MLRLRCLEAFSRYSFSFSHYQFLNVFCVLFACLSFTASANNDKTTFKDTVRIGYIPHQSFSVDNGVTSGALSRVMECSLKIFPRIEFVEMPSYERLMFSLDTNVVDIGLNMIRTKQRDALAKYAVDIYRSRVLLVTRDDGSNKASLKELPIGRLGARLGSEIGKLLAIKGYKVDVNAYTVDRLIEMFRAKHINSFAEAEISVFDDLVELDAERFDYDYRVLSEKWGGAYLSFPFEQKHSGIINEWKKVVESCRYFAPELN